MNQLNPININKLLLDVDNPRFPTPADNQRDAIAKMLELQYDRIYRLAKDIALRGLDPSENVLVYSSEDEDGFYVVAEGNRRVTALKLLLSPSLAPNERARKAFEKIKLTQKEDIKVINNCVIFDDDSYQHWVNLKHTGQNNGVGRVEWTAPEKARHLARLGKQSFGNQIFTFIESNPEHYPEIIEKKSSLKITNITRIFGDVAVRDFFNLDNINGMLYCFQPYNRFIEQLNKILVLMIEKEDNGRSAFTVNRIRGKKERLMLMHEQNITPSDVLFEKPWLLIDESAKVNNQEANGANADAEKENNSGNEKKRDENPDSKVNDEPESDNYSHNNEKESDGNTEKENQSEDDDKPTRPPKRDRNNLIPSYVKLNFKKHKKCSRIFSELKSHLTYDTTPNAISILLRVFIDLSVTSFIEDNKIEHKDSSRNPGLHDKVILCAHHLREKKKITGSQSTAVIAFSSQLTKANGSLHQYVHNPHMISSKEAINDEWDAFETLLMKVWS